MPDNIILVHGERTGMKRLKDELERYPLSCPVTCFLPSLPPSIPPPPILSFVVTLSITFSLMLPIITRSPSLISPHYRRDLGVLRPTASNSTPDRPGSTRRAPSPIHAETTAGSPSPTINDLMIPNGGPTVCLRKA